MSAIHVLLPDSLHEEADKLAQKECVSIDKLIEAALAEKLAAHANETYFAARAKRGSREKFLRLMAKVPRVEPEEHDKL